MQLITYKVITCGQHGMISGQQTGSLDSASGSHGQCPIHVVGQPPKPPLGTDQHADFEEIQARRLTSTAQNLESLQRELLRGSCETDTAMHAHKAKLERSA